ncbi:CBN-ACL-8 protein [Caenorhabditis brenneri]|uniref:CBN-ACL-8 protein n=1 Tax=Caenorhabditis brenneri TaxID=135651 RepID=G0MXU6_CAEBE|nr:CBN-ACL-8 protein [Caenorhabditis brenneri]
MKVFKGVAFIVLVFLSSLLGTVFLLFPFVSVAWLSPKLWRKIADRLVGFWLTFPCSLIEWVFGVKFRVTGDLIDRNEPAILIMNHRTRLDWLFSWNALYKMDPWLLTSEKISLKAPLKMIPGAGWAMSSGSYIFLDRNFEKDKPVLERIVRYYEGSGNKYQILLFAEGTDKGERATQLSHAFADKNGLPRYEYVLHPRTTGFRFLLDMMKKDKYIKNVYDLTIAYSGTIVDTEKKLLAGNLPDKVHLDVKKYKLEEIPEGDGCEKWLTDLWATKEKRLKKFYEEEERLEASGDRFEWPETTSGIGYSVAFAFWVLASVLWISAIYSLLWVKIYVAIAITFYIASLKFYNGAEFIFLKWFEEKCNNDDISKNK